jgi:glycosyltransferase involved in cell wall biosynthesis
VTLAASAPPFTVVVPAFRACATLTACLRALDASLPRPSRVVVVDDGCPDGSGALAASLGAEVIPHGENRGTSAARNTGWRAADTAWVAFVDADVAVRPDAFARLFAALTEERHVGANGTLAPLEPPAGFVDHFVNASLRHQLEAHGPRVGTAFTALCVFRRDTLVAMGGWDTRRSSRYGDDVATRWHLPPDALLQVPTAQALHHKSVTLRGLLRHRANIGLHFLASLRENRDAVRARPGRSVLALRYPLHAALAGASLPAALAATHDTRSVPPLALGFALAWVIANLGLVRRLAREDSPLRAPLAIPLAALEGYALLAGLALGVLRIPLRMEAPRDVEA